MNWHLEDSYIRQHLMDGEFGLEKESLRVTAEGRFAHTAHPFSKENTQIVRDFCENQTEINTGVHDSIDGALGELRDITGQLNRVLKEMPEPEYLWRFSNPPYIKNEADIPVAVFGGKQRSKTLYRDYLSDKYGRYIMTFSGIHLNYSFAHHLLRREFLFSGEESFYAFRNRLYLSLAQGLVEYGWILVAVTSASPLLDGSFYVRGRKGETVFSGMASVRCSELGYWNDFIPVLDYQSVGAYAKSIRRYIEEGWINGPSELYYPIRLKSRGENNLDTLEEKGVNHIELRMIDLNPFAKCGVDARDIFFAQLLMLWICARGAVQLSPKDQVRAVGNFKKAAHFDLSTVSYVTGDGRSIPMNKAGQVLIRQLKDFYKGFSDEVTEVLEFEYGKLADIKNSYAWRVKEEFGDSFTEKGLVLAKERQ